MVVPFAPGGSDIVARMLAPKLSEKLGQPFVVENRPGAGSVVGSEIVAKAAPDGYTLLFCTSSLSTTAAYLKKPPYDAVHDFAGVAQIGWLPFALVAHPALPVKTVKEFIALARRKPGELFYPSPGTGSIGHLVTEFFAKEVGIKVTHVAYKGSGPMITALLTGEVQFAMPNVSAALAVIRAGKVRTLGVAAPERIALAPELGTLRENGVDLVAGPWYGVVAPRGTPQPIVDLLNRDITALVQSPDMREKLTARGMVVEALAPSAFAAVIKADIEKWSGVMRAAGISQE
jgi:tripartite-type tricarboxylate transporter receptor subunit TctC